MMIGGDGAKASSSDCVTPVTITLQNPDGQGEGTVVAAQVAKMIPINLPRDGKSVTKIVEVQGAVQAGHTIYQIIVEPLSSSNSQGQVTEGEQDRFMLGQVMQVAQDQESSVPKTQGTAPVGLNSSALGISNPSKPPQLAADTQPSKPLPPGCPPWASRLNDVEEIGDSYRGYVESDVELDLLLTYHKQQTGSYWGTRQSPSNERPSKRLMWKSQYVPYDGIPFINSGSRAVVMECQYGPRRKGAAAKKLESGKKGFQVTCPARIYIKKVKKFPQFRVLADKDGDKKLVRQAQDNAFLTIKEMGVDTIKGVERYYVQLPTAKAHEYHDQFPTTGLPASYYNKAEDILHCKSEPAVVVKEVQSADTVNIREGSMPVMTMGPTQHIDSKVAEKIRELVSHGIVNAYIIRQNLRNYVMHKLFSPGSMPERHNLTYFPTINNIQNHVYEALKAIEQGELVPVVPVSLADLAGMTAPPLRRSSSTQEQEEDDLFHREQVMMLPAVSTSAGGSLQAQTVTVTLTQNPDDVDGSAIISRVETQMTDGTTRVCDSISPETAQLLSQLTPKMFTHQNITQVQETSEGTVTIQMQRLTESQAATSELNQSQTLLQTYNSTINQPEGLLHPDDPSTSSLDQSGDLLEAPGTDHLGQSGSLLESDASDAHVSPTDVLLQATESADELHQSDPLLQHEHSAIDQSEVMSHKGVMSELSQAEDQASLLLSMHENISLSHSASEMQDDSDPNAHEHDTGESMSKRPRLDVDDISDCNTLPQ
ncbi:calcium-responsive transcription factor-like isoform X2 [Amphiura filiformis]|uniref:calcium-responsive transcription factor-like isoform X2 n=1 Tax=Amphiura filiformis TaxID=82378 RepID=UPI003B217B32